MTNGQPIVKTYICLYEWLIRGIGVYPLSAGGAQTLEGVFDGLPVELSMERAISASLSTVLLSMLKSGRGSRFTGLIGSMNGASTILSFMKAPSTKARSANHTKHPI